ncbi:uncharacterized protein N0V89_009930 [Didymosphaeria variabile]|uniref:Heterokaryon incompatibility domain-containing protein n=1 Tax=Didymosphaeria variabile TaxID=1932322 RepID=A0A9W9C7R1_9PLEO|nr:uncharacterized protein N0V89_009930 [Didymosphaeria variabile]KAJ4348553.1 hypothetical protein N0V89_009930 [Didymosphaeria variabile]
MDHYALPLTAEQTYQYSDLPSPTHTRLLELQPASDVTTELRCHIHVVDLYDVQTPLYDAISYTWGGETFSQSLLVDHKDEPSRMRITANLFDALCMFRRQDASRLLWADAVCINQKDDAEKSKHITLMTDIYRVASTVLVWLGYDTTADRAVARIDRLARLANLPSKSHSKPHLGPLRFCLSNLVNLPWFSRRWIIQEVVLNPNVVLHCGAERILFVRLGLVVDVLDSQSQTASENTRQLRAVVAMFRLWRRWALRENKPQSETRLQRLIEHFDHFECFDSRDRLFTLAALAGDVRLHTDTKHSSRGSEYLHIIVDYESPLEDIYTMAARMILNYNQFAWILDQAMMRSYQNNDGILPSWVPDWRTPRQGNALLCEHVSTSVRKPMYETDANHDPTLVRLHEEPQIRDLANTGEYLLRANFSYVEHWVPYLHSAPDNWDRPGNASTLVRICSENQFENFKYLSNNATSSTITSRVDNNSFAPLVIKWKSTDFPSSAAHSDILTWIDSTISSIRDRYLVALGFGNETATPANTRLHQSTWDAWIDRFVWVITAGGKFFDHLSVTHQQDLAALCESSKEEWSYPRKHRPACTEQGDIDILTEYEQRVKPKVDWWKVSSILRKRLRADAAEMPLHPLTSLIAFTMEGRCLFACDTIESSLDMLAPEIMGIGGIAVIEGCRIMSLPSLKGSTLWARSLVVRPVVANSQEALSQAIDRTVDLTELDRQRIGSPPVYKLISSCYMSTTRWVSPLRGLYEPKWNIRQCQHRDWGAKYHVDGPVDRRNSASRLFNIILI